MLHTTARQRVIVRRSHGLRDSLCTVLLLLGGCLPAQLDKYRGGQGDSAARGNRRGGEVGRAQDPFLPADHSHSTDEGPPGRGAVPHNAAKSTTAKARLGEGASEASAEAERPVAPPDRSDRGARWQPNVQAPPRATIYAIDKSTYRFTLREPEVWDAALNVLLRNYNLTIVDRSSGIIATEWDSYYLDRAVYRNKLSLRVARGSGGVDMTIRNSVERLRDASEAAGAVGAVWLPTTDPGNEVVRIVQNMAILLNQPPPVVPPQSGAVASGEGLRGGGVSR